jgi:prepilin-type N-terminal cleavage/methylation domain-containing protein
MKLYTFKNLQQCKGFSAIELVIACAIIGILVAIAVPQYNSMNRLMHSAAMYRLVMSQLRVARQEAISQRQAITFQYNNVTKQIRILDHGEDSSGDPQTVTSGSAILADPNYPNNSRTISTISLASSTVPAGAITYGIPTGAPITALSDTTTLTNLTSNNTINITFQPDGKVIDANNRIVNHALYFYNSQAPLQTATAISILGSAGRSKIWRFNGSTYVAG